MNESGRLPKQGIEKSPYLLNNRALTIIVKTLLLDISQTLSDHAAFHGWQSTMGSTCRVRYFHLSHIRIIII